MDISRGEQQEHGDGPGKKCHKKSQNGASFIIHLIATSKNGTYPGRGPSIKNNMLIDVLQVVCDKQLLNLGKVTEILTDITIILKI